MKATLLLADSAQAIAGKLYILGGGWSVTGPEPSPSALALKLEVPWDRANHPFQLLFELVDADGQPVLAPGEGEGSGEPLKIAATFEAGRPPGLVPGTPLDGALAVNLGPIPLEAGRYAWRFSVDGQSESDWQVGFTVRGGGGSAS